MLQSAQDLEPPVKPERFNMFIATYHLLDIMPKGRDEEELPYSMQWIRHHDRYDDPEATDAIR